MEIKIINNKRGDIATTILVIGILLICGIAIFSFFNSMIQTKNSFVGINLIEQMNAQVEKNYFDGQEIGINNGDSEKTINDAFDYAKENRIINRQCNCGANCNSYANFIVQSASNNGINEPLLLLSLMMQESDCTANAFSGSSVGLMQINLMHCGKYGLPANKEECKKMLIDNSQLNIETGAKILRENYNAYKDGKVFQGCSNRNILYSGWEAALRGYNGWGCDPTFAAQDNFVEEVINRYNILKKVGGNYIEKREIQGFLFWAKEVLLFSVQYQPNP